MSVLKQIWGAQPILIRARLWADRKWNEMKPVATTGGESPSESSRKDAESLRRNVYAVCVK